MNDIDEIRFLFFPTNEPILEELGKYVFESFPRHGKHKLFEVKIYNFIFATYQKQQRNYIMYPVCVA